MNVNEQMPFPLIVFAILVTVFAEHGHRAANIVRQGCSWAVTASHRSDFD